MKRMIVDASSLIWTGLLAGKDVENGREIEFEGKKVWVNSGDYGYDNATNSLVTTLKALSMTPSQVIIVTEGQYSKAQRTAIFNGYKANRSARPPEVYEAFNKTKEMLTAAFRSVGAQIVTQDGVEADDIIAFLCQNLKDEIVIWSNDGDLSVLINERVSQWRKGMLTKENPYGPFPHKLIAVYKALVGDTSDGYKGAAGFGDKAFLDFLVWGGNGGLAALEGMIKRKTLHELEDDVADFKPLRKVIDGAKHVEESYKCALLYPEWVDTLRRPLKWECGMVSVPTDTRLKQWGAQLRLVTTANYEAAVTFFKARMAETPWVCLDLETTVPEESDQWLEQRSKTGSGVDVIASTIVGCGLTFGANNQYGFYVSVNHADTENVTLDQLRLLLECIPKDKLTLAHNAAGFELPVLFNAFGKEWANNGWRGMYPNMVDTRIAASYWDEDQPSHGLKQLSRMLLGYEQVSYAEVTQGRKMDEMTAKETFDYGIDDVLTTTGLWNYFHTVMELEGTYDAFMRIEQKPMYLSALSYIAGTPISMSRLAALRSEDDEAYQKHEKTLHTYLLEQGWDGTVCPKLEELTAAGVKQAVEIILGDTLKSQVRTVSKLAKLIEEMEHPDAATLATLVAEDSVEAINEWMARKFDGKPQFDVASPKQTSKLVYEHMRMPVRLRNKVTAVMRSKGIREGSPKTDDDALNMALKFGDAEGEVGEVLKALIELRSINTRRGLYWEPYPKMLHWKTGRIHPELRQCATNTRRHTSGNPNIQQLGSEPGGVRSIILPHHNNAVFVSLDLAGQEIRLLGDMSGDENIKSAYIGDPPKDLHSFTAAMILGIAYDEFRERYKSKDEAIASEANTARQRGKTVFFASSYGAMAPKIALGLGVSEAEAQSYLDALDRAFPRVGEWKRETEELAQTEGWVPIIGGTRRHLRNILLSDDKWIAQKGLRQASNARIQGGGGNQIRTIMGRVWDSNLFETYDVRFYWPVHDELCFSVHRDHAVPVIQALHSFMCEKFLDTLLSASSIGIGATYGSLNEIGEVADAELITEAVGKCFAVTT